MEEKKHLFSNRDLRLLLVPVVIEQVLASLMGTADTMMVSNVGSAAISAVSLVDSINVLVIQVTVGYEKRPVFRRAAAFGDRGNLHFSDGHLHRVQ